MKKIIPAVVIAAFLTLTFTSCSRTEMPDEKEAQAFVKKRTTHYGSDGLLQAVTGNEINEAYVLFYSKKFAGAILADDLTKAKDYAMCCKSFCADGMEKDATLWKSIGELIDRKKMEPLKGYARTINEEFRNMN